MKKTASTALALFLLLSVAAGAVACGSDGGSASKPVVNVSQTALYCDLGESVTLPAATASDEKDGDLSAQVKVAVYSGETVALAERAGNVANEFVPESAGAYVAKYSVVNSSEVLSDIKTVNITVGETPEYGDG